MKGRDVLIKELNLDPRMASTASGAFRGAGARMVINRLLANLKRSYVGTNALFQLRWVLELTLLINTGAVPRTGAGLESEALEAAMLGGGSDLQEEMDKIDSPRGRGRYDRDLRLLARVRAALN